ncbi:MAG: hypothetical protein ACRC2Q_14685, partial [Cetobacterium sp.]
MKEKLLFLFSLLIILNKTSLSSNDDTGVIFFTNFNYFKSNEKNFKDVGVEDEGLSLMMSSSDENPTIPPLINPDSDKPIKPEIPVPPDENIPPVKPTNPDKPEVPEIPEDKYTEIFFENNWIWNTHTYVDSEDVIVSSSSGILTGMGAIQSGFTAENVKNILVNGDSSDISYVGMLSLNGAKIINGEEGTIVVEGIGNDVGMGIVGEGEGRNLGTISVSNSQTGVGIYVTEQGVGENIGTINVGNKQLAMLVEKNGSIFNSGVISINSQGIGMVANNASEDSFLLNEENGVIKGDAQVGILINGNSSTQNYGKIDISNGVAGILVNGQGSSYNFSSINLINTSYGMLSQNGGIIVNGGSGYNSTITTDNTEIAKMAVLGS